MPDRQTLSGRAAVGRSVRGSLPYVTDGMVLGQPLLLLIGGGSGVGKSTVATELARHLGITRVSSTDFIREVMRSLVPEASLLSWRARPSNSRQAPFAGPSVGNRRRG